MNFFKSDFMREGERSIKFRFGFPGETGHDISRNRGMWEIASQAAAKRFIFRAGVMPVHAAERCITAALEREVELWAELFTLRKPRHYLRREMIRRQGAEAHAQDTVYRAGTFHRIADGTGEILPIGGEIDSHEHNLQKARIPKPDKLCLQLAERL